MPLQLITPPNAEPLHLNDALLHIKQDAGIDDAHILATIVAARKSAENQTWRQLIAARYKQVMDSFPGRGQFGVPWGTPFAVPGNAIVLDKAPVLQVESIHYLAMDGSIGTVSPSDYAVDYACEPCRITPLFGKIWPIPLPQIGAAWVTYLAGYAAPLRADTAADTLSVTTWQTLAVGDRVRFSNSGGTLPAPLLANTDYYVVAVPAAGTYQMATTAGGMVIDITEPGSGTSFIGEVPGDILTWMRMRVGALDVFREATVAMGRGKIESLPFVDGLLDSYTTW